MKKIQHNSGPGVVLGIPTLGRPVPLDWALNFKSLTPPINYNIVMQIIQGEAIDIARNKMARFALDQGSKYLFFLGDDVVCPPHTLKQLIYRMEQDPELSVVGGVYCSKCDPPAPLVFKGNGVGSYWDWKVGEYFEVSGLGMDCTLIRTSILAKLSEPWFNTVEIDGHIDAKNSVEAWTEDLYFFNKLQQEIPEAKIFCDSMLVCKHYDVYSNKAYTLPSDSLPMRQRAIEKNKRCLYIGPQTLGITDQDFEVVTFGSEESDYRGDKSQLPFGDKEFDWVIVTDLTNSHVSELKNEWLRVARGKVTLAWNNPFFNLSGLRDYYCENHLNASVVENKYIEVLS